MPLQVPLMPIAPDGLASEYDRCHLALYAALIDADVAGVDWREVADTLMRLDPENEQSEHCWHSHLERARWIIGPGLAQAVDAFGPSES